MSDHKKYNEILKDISYAKIKLIELITGRPFHLSHPNLEYKLRGCLNGKLSWHFFVQSLEEEFLKLKLENTKESILKMIAADEMYKALELTLNRVMDGDPVPIVEIEEALEKAKYGLDMASKDQSDSRGEQ